MSTRMVVVEMGLRSSEYPVRLPGTELSADWSLLGIHTATNIEVALA
jgi:hypothetical protein